MAEAIEVMVLGKVIGTAEAFDFLEYDGRGIVVQYDIFTSNDLGRQCNLPDNVTCISFCLEAGEVISYNNDGDPTALDFNFAKLLEA